MIRFIPLGNFASNGTSEREMDKTDIPGTFNAGATLGPVNETNMARIWNKHKQTNTPLKRKVFVAMSGGVDSSVAAALLKKDGYDVTGVHMLCWEGCENNQDKQDAMRVAAVLDIPFLVWDFKKEYREAVFNYMVREYAEGRTPNPDVICNKEIKFGIFLKRALEAGADFIATGHYVRAEPTRLARGLTLSSGAPTPTRNPSGFSSLFTTKDSSKDQSYFLWTLTQDQLKHCLFPIGDYLKSEVRQIALEAGLPVAEKKDSQGLCFVGKVDFQEFLRGILPKHEGVVLNSEGEILGHHDGAEFFTVGQRHGLNIGGMPEPLYVAEKNTATNTLVMAKSANDPILYKGGLEVSDLNWIAGVAPNFPLECLARIRYRQPLQRGVVNCQQSNVNCSVVFNDCQRAIAPGQSIVFYKEDGTMLGGGIIK